MSRTVALGASWLGVFGARLGQMHYDTSIGEVSVFNTRANRADLSRDTGNGRSVLRPVSERPQQRRNLALP